MLNKNGSMIFSEKLEQITYKVNKIDMKEKIFRKLDKIWMNKMRTLIKLKMNRLIRFVADDFTRF